MKYILTGTAGTGKSTLLHHFDNKMNVITEVVRNLAKTDHIKVNEDGDYDGQNKIFNTYYDIFEKTDGPWISDRGLTDVIAYTCYNVKNKGREGENFLQDQLDKFIKFQTENKDVVYFYVPIEFAVVDDGFRSLNEDFRKEIDKNIKDLLDVMNVDYIELRGSVEERLEVMEDVMRNYGDIQ